VLIASTTEVVITATFGLIGTIVGALISRAVAVSTRRSDKDDEVRQATVKFFVALEELRAQKSMEDAHSAQARLVELGFAAMGAGIDTRLAHGAIRYGGEMLLLYPTPEGKLTRVDPLVDAATRAAALVAAVNKVPYWRRRGPFMEPYMRDQAEEYGTLDEFFDGIIEPPETGLMWRLVRFWNRVHRRIARFWNWLRRRIARFWNWLCRRIARFWNWLCRRTEA
jgi:hypothetical protein